MISAWPIVPLSTIFRALNAGVSVNGSDEATGSEIGVLKVSCVRQGRFLASENKRVVAQDIGRVAVSPRRGDIIISRANTPELVGASGYVEKDYPNLYLSDKLWRAVMAEPAIDEGRWLVALLNSDQLRRELRCRATGTSGSMKNISQDALLAIAVPRPPREVQAKLGLLFEQFGVLLDQLEAAIQAKQKLKTGLMRQLLTGRKRFPEFAARKWTWSRLGDHVAEIGRRNTFGTDLVLTASGAHGLVDQRRYFNRNVAGVDLSRYYLLRRGEFAYNRSAMSGYPYGATKRLDQHDEGALSTLYLCFGISDPKLDSEYLKHVFESGTLNHQLRPIIKVGARAHGLLNVAEEDYFSINIPFPGIDEQRRIAHILSAFDQEIELLETQRKLIERHRRGLLSKILSGEITVPA